MSTTGGVQATSGARERILNTAYALFCQRGVRDVGVDEVISHSNVAKATLYRHFPSKTDLVLAYLARREQLWTHGTVERESERRGSSPETRLLAIFDVFDEWFQRQADFEACPFITTLLEMGTEHPLGKASIDHLANIRALVRERAQRAGLRDVDAFAQRWHILMKGSIIAATEGEYDAAQHAKAMARQLIELHR